MKILVKFPCRKCLVKIMCKDSCHKLKDFDDWMESAWVGIPFITIIMFIVLSPILLLSYKISWWLLFLIPVLWLLCHFWLDENDREVILWSSLDKESILYLAALPAYAIGLKLILEIFANFYEKHAPVKF